MAQPPPQGTLLMDAVTFLTAAGSGAAKTRTIAFNATGATVLSWRSDSNYRIIEVSGVGQALLNLVGGTYAALTAAGVHLDWISLVSTSTTWADTEMNADLINGQILYSSHGAGNSLLQAILAYN
jgi:hypothetical protein